MTSSCSIRSVKTMPQGMKRKIVTWTVFALALFVIGVALGINYVVYVNSATSSPTTPGLPTTPPALPSQITNGDGTRLNCTPNYQFCWPAH